MRQAKEKRTSIHFIVVSNKYVVKLIELLLLKLIIININYIDQERIHTDASDLQEVLFRHNEDLLDFQWEVE